MNKNIFQFIILLFFLTFPFIGKVNISFGDILNSNSENYVIFWNLRFPNFLLAFIVGAGLSLVGYIFQTIFRNPLATPYTLGVASGASFGAVIALSLGLSASIWIFNSVAFFSLMGSAIAVTLVFLFANLKKYFDPYRILLAGVSSGLMFSSLILFIQFLNLGTGINDIIQWLMGSLSTIGYQSHVLVVSFLIVTIFLLIKYYNELSLIRFNQEIAFSRGVDVFKIKRNMFLMGSFLTAIIVSEVGPIGFVGLIIPHLTKLIFKEDRFFALKLVIVGGSFLSFCEVLSRTLLSQGTLPIGILTAMIGTPFFIYILMKKSH